MILIQLMMTLEYRHRDIFLSLLMGPNYDAVYFTEGRKVCTTASASSVLACFISYMKILFTKRSQRCFSNCNNYKKGYLSALKR